MISKENSLFVIPDSKKTEVNLFRSILFLILYVCAASPLYAQMIEDPTVWNFEAKHIQGEEYEIQFQVKVNEDYHIYALEPGGDGAFLPPSFEIEPNPIYEATGPLGERGKKISEHIEDIGTVFYYKEAVYYQPARIRAPGALKGTYTYMVCNDVGCLPPKTKSFTLRIGDGGSQASEEQSPPGSEDATGQGTGSDSQGPEGSGLMGGGNTSVSDTLEGSTVLAGAAVDEQENEAGDEEKKSLIWLFLMSLGGGIAAVLTPCVYSMIPITVSFFTKKSRTRSEGIRNAIWYSLSIIIIFTLLGMLISLIFGGNALNNLSTNWIANLVFFAIFAIFGISFLGAFEITLPSSWTSTTDSKAGLGSLGGIFFMALTLVIVSFSCTGPIVGPLLVLAGKGGVAGPMLGMFGFSVGLALPFAVFAVFPGLLNKMASSGGWLNQVKVVLGFLELMLALKFLSNADLARGWRLLDREVFIAIWIVLAVMLGLYLLGKLKLSHDDAPPKNIYGQEYVSLFKLGLAITSFSFALYLLPGMWGAPLNGMSQFVPPMGTQDFVIGAQASTGPSAPHSSQGPQPVKYVEEMRIYEPPVVRNMGLVTYFEYEEALAAAKIIGKPVMLDFTGINCVNCRKMESQVWSKPEVSRRLKEDFIVASLYCDYDKRALPEDEQYYSEVLRTQIKTVGDRNEDLQATLFHSNSQPFYYFVDEDGNPLVDKGYGYDPNVEKFVQHLDLVLENYRKSKS